MNITDPLSFFMPGTNGQAILLVHGLTGAPAEMRLVARQLNRRGYTIYAPLLAGHGKDVAALRTTSWRHWLESVDRAASDLASHASVVFAAGICVGGALGLLSAHQNPGTIKAAALYSPCFQYDGWNVPFYYPLLSRQIGWLSRVPFLDRLSFAETSTMGIKDERMRRMMAAMSSEGVLERFPGKGLVEMYRLGIALKKRLPEISTPTLILHSREDDLSDPRHAEYIRSHIGGRRQLHWIDDSYHMIHVDRQRLQVADITADFFEEAHAREPS
ncbi:alpha/beta fold hydrolase [Phyllobacterium salinisoli]|uniref:Alpha/beta fold hydrolase n=1 Tax=Phyllobacterium salinisoli TaxID=1899321 RepID=A0A368JXH5_9HYPH|nr:alpha/beta fold hydrolase [Phyllobacterium salinisoli]RCS21651.1 alpha/beta fold hydrolase [Phyllobacterium salinisoli]